MHLWGSYKWRVAICFFSMLFVLNVFSQFGHTRSSGIASEGTSTCTWFVGGEVSRFIGEGGVSVPGPWLRKCDLSALASLKISSHRFHLYPHISKNFVGWDLRQWSRSPFLFISLDPHSGHSHFTSISRITLRVGYGSFVCASYLVSLLSGSSSLWLISVSLDSTM